MKHLDGTWVVMALETDGNKIPAAMIGESKIIVSGDRFTTVAMGASYAGRLSINELVTPHTLDLHFEEGPHAGIASLAIYKMKGNDWTICLGFAGNERPTQFKTSPGSGNALEILTRDSTAKLSGAKSKATRTAVPSSAPTSPSSEMNARVADPQSKYPDEINALGGEWSAQAIVMNGQALPVEYLKVGRRIATGNELKVTMAGQVQVHTGFVVDPTQSPRHINYFDLKNPKNGFTQFGIYELTGATLKACMGGKGMARPTVFESTSGDGNTFSVWKKN
ncbi:MAG: TIGR03067 domain-containing protein [Gemmatimonadaceae bacterium]